MRSPMVGARRGPMVGAMVDRVQLASVGRPKVDRGNG